MMIKIRRFEEKVGQLYSMGLIGGFCHLYIGQEGVISGIEMLADNNDCFITGYRCHAHMVTRGEPMVNIFSELLGNSSGSSPADNLGTLSDDEGDGPFESGPPAGSAEPASSVEPPSSTVERTPEKSNKGSPSTSRSPTGRNDSTVFVVRDGVGLILVISPPPCFNMYVSPRRSWKIAGFVSSA